METTEGTLLGGRVCHAQPRTGHRTGLEPVLLQSAWFRPHNRSEDIERL